ncbi:hypothetical protein L226DRAFT_570093 [Lentinus tigrinus ALCF2SS1-7]|uniref:DUF6534 domain-containing protein n=1 Tax=Lentinus tigrinus ALCF2SS1-6 TaxID=1328759 RepID=A0A5C2S9V9_9APHY|nr:hypothetical protein L227DRAFT_611140 [Lentinus tigrinus ALCF2SS1-6]RPD75856.1 hypothetical protein L226DRAFT_570093 [Lentinus tigrinus ALCF2SS1-7]
MATLNSTMNSLPPIPAMDNTYGALLLGTCGGLLVQGLIFHQLYQYFKCYPNDATYLKIWVSVVAALELITSAFTMHASYYYMVTNAFNPEVLLTKPPWSLTWNSIPGTAAAVFVEMFFCRRLWLVQRKFRPIAVVALLLDLTCFGCYAALVIMGSEMSNAADFLKNSYLASVGSGCIGLGDSMVTASLIYVLHTSRTGIKETSSMIDILIKYAVSTGLIISIFNVLIFATSVAYSESWIYVGISFPITKIYLTTFLVALNVRKSLMSSEILLKEQTVPMGSRFANAEVRDRFQADVSHISFRRPAETSTAMSSIKFATDDLGMTLQPTSHTESIPVTSGEMEGRDGGRAYAEGDNGA